jgi:ribonucleoside-triphosphate reductase
VISAVGKSAYRALTKFTREEKEQICRYVVEKVNELEVDEVPIPIMHNIVESALEQVKPVVAKSYRDYRNYKQDFVRMLDDVYKKSQSIMYIGDKENANTDSALVSTKRSLIFNQLNKELYQKFFLTTEEIQACRDGYIYVHDMSARRDTMNCCLFDVQSVLTGGFEMGNIWYNEPKTLDVAFDVIGDIVLSAASQQYGGFTVPSVDLILEPYAEKSYNRALAKYERLGIAADVAEAEALADVQKEFEQGFQGWEYKFNTVASSRGDYPFITVTAGTGTGKFAKMATITMLDVRRKGQGKKDHKKPVLFPKIVFLYDENLHGPGKPLEDVFEAGVECSAKTMYPDWLSLTGKGYVASMYKQYGKIVSPMGCRAFLSPWYERGGMHPADDKDQPVFVGRFNIGAVSLHLPMILAKARKESKDFYEVLDYYLELIRQLHIRTYAYLGEMRASTNPLAYCEGGFLGGHLKLTDKIKPLLKSATASFGITALNELQELYNGKSLVEDGAFAVEVLEHINQKISEYKEEDGNLYAIYGTPAERVERGEHHRERLLLAVLAAAQLEHGGVVGGVDHEVEAADALHRDDLAAAQGCGDGVERGGVGGDLFLQALRRGAGAGRRRPRRDAGRAGISDGHQCAVLLPWAADDLPQHAAGAGLQHAGGHFRRGGAGWPQRRWLAGGA